MKKGMFSKVDMALMGLDEEHNCVACGKECTSKSYGVEVNGPANIIAHLDWLLKQSPYKEDDALNGYLQIISRQAYKTIEYIKQLENPKNVAWHDIKIEE